MEIDDAGILKLKADGNAATNFNKTYFGDTGYDYSVYVKINESNNSYFTDSRKFTFKTPETNFKDLAIEGKVNKSDTKQMDLDISFSIERDYINNYYIYTKVYYKPADTKNAYEYIEEMLIYNELLGGCNGTVSIDGLIPGVTYDFMLYVGGAAAKTQVQVGMDELSVKLVKVKDSTDYTGPYDFVRTVKAEPANEDEELADSYSLYSVINYKSMV